MSTSEPVSSVLSVFWQHASQRFELTAQQVFDTCDDCAVTLLEAMRYVTLNGGKRLRPALVYAVAQLYGSDSDPYIDAIAVAVEFVHAYSLVHDDLPAMDNDDLRRGLPTCHKAFDEATAILAGDALQTLAFEVLATSYADSGSKMAADRQIKVIKILAQASGTAGMAAGQSLDLAATGKQLIEPEIRQIHQLKTGRLITAAIEMAALAIADISEQEKQALTQFGLSIGLAFQIRDDILDEIGDTQTLGKTAGADASLSKATYPSVMSVEAAQQQVEFLYTQALQALACIRVDTTLLQQIAAFLTQRTT